MLHAGHVPRSGRGWLAVEVAGPRTTLCLAATHTQGMEYLHAKNVVHFDVKTANLLVSWSMRACTRVRGERTACPASRKRVAARRPTHHCRHENSAPPPRTPTHLIYIYMCYTSDVRTLRAHESQTNDQPHRHREANQATPHQYGANRKSPPAYSSALHTNAPGDRLHPHNCEPVHGPGRASELAMRNEK